MWCLRKINLHEGLETLTAPLISRERLVEYQQADALLERAKQQAIEMLKQTECQRVELLEREARRFWQNANTQLDEWKTQHKAICDTLEIYAARIINQAILTLLGETPPPQRLRSLLEQLLATQVPAIKATLLCNPTDRPELEQWLNSHADVPWTLRTEDSLAIQTLTLETDEGGFHIGWDETLKNLLLPEK